MTVRVGVAVCMYILKQISISFGLCAEFLFDCNMAQQKYLLIFQKNTFKTPCKEVILGENYTQIKP